MTNRRFTCSPKYTGFNMRQYLDLLNKVLFEGEWQDNRTGIPTKRLDGAMMQFDLSKGFPAVTTKQLAFKAVKGELIGFIRGYDNAAAFRNVGCNVWDQNANDNEAWLKNEHRKGHDDLGRIYGQQWRGWYHDTCGRIDQLKNAINEIINNPTSRRIIVSAWNPADMDKMALPPCHMMFQLLVNVEKKSISMCMYQRSCDMFLGVPFNIASYALLLELICLVTGYKAGKLTMFMADVHIYRAHMEQVVEQLNRPTKALPTLELCDSITARNSDPVKQLEMTMPGDIMLIGYEHHPAIKAEMMV